MSLIPRIGAGNTLPIMVAPQSPHIVLSLAACLSSLPVDYLVRQKVGGNHLNFFLAEQFPVLPPSVFEDVTPWDRARPLAGWLGDRVLKLVYTAADLSGVARDLGYQGAPFRWDAERRSVLRAELDASFFHVSGIDRDDMNYVLDSFPAVARQDEAKFGEFRTNSRK